MPRSSVVSRIAHDVSRASDAKEGIPWWDTLPLDFADHEEPFELEFKDRVRVDVTAAADVALRTVGAALVGALAMPLGYHPLKLHGALKDRSIYEPLALSGDADRFFIRPPTTVPILRRDAPMPLFKPDDGFCEDVRFESPFLTVNPRLQRSYYSHQNNRFAHARHWHHGSKPRKTIIAIHGFSADLYHLNEWFFAIPWLYKQGYDILLVTLPFHGKRQDTLSPFSGHGFFAGGASHINEAFAQAVFDIRIFLDDLLLRGAPEVGVMGVSLGGLTTSLLASAESRLAFAIPNVPVITLGDLVLEWEPIGITVRALLKLLRRDIRDARKLLAVSCPLTYKPRLARERLMIIGGVGDRLAPPKHSRILWEHWGHCNLHWFPGSHLVHFDRGQYLRHIKKFLGQLGW